MNESLEQMIARLQEHQQLQSLSLTKDSDGEKNLLAFLNASDRTGYLHDTLLPFVQNRFLHRKIQNFTFITAKIVFYIFIVLLLIGIIIAA